MESEGQLQAACFQFAWNTYIRLRYTFFRVPNEAKRNNMQAKREQALGLVAGIPDIIFMEPRFGVEFKLGTDQSINQKKVEAVWGGLGIDYYIVKDIESFKQLLMDKCGHYL